VSDDELLLGLHVSISGGVHLAVDRAAALGCTTFQIFPSNPRGWRQKAHPPEDVAAFRAGVKRLGLQPFFVHMPYLPNIASPDDALYEKSVAALVAAVETTASLGGRYLVTHLGSHRGAGAQTGRERAATAIRAAVEATPRARVTILMENAAGKSNQVGTTFTEITELFKMINKRSRRRVGLCVDSCHAHVMDYDLAAGGTGLARVLDEVAAFIGVDKIKLLHLNDAVGEAGSGLDRHAHIGHGTIGREGFRRFVDHPALRHLPMILETPQKDGWDKKNLRTVRRLWKKKGATS
jgi:deoxyribonuclease-4